MLKLALGEVARDADVHGASAGVAHAGKLGAVRQEVGVDAGCHRRLEVLESCGVVCQPLQRVLGFHQRRPYRAQAASRRSVSSTPCRRALPAWIKDAILAAAKAGEMPPPVAVAAPVWRARRDRDRRPGCPSPSAGAGVAGRRHRPVAARRARRSGDWPAPFSSTAAVRRRVVPTTTTSGPVRVVGPARAASPAGASPRHRAVGPAARRAGATLRQGAGAGEHRPAPVVPLKLLRLRRR